jgi:hypothetical protein
VETKQRPNLYALPTMPANRRVDPLRQTCKDHSRPALPDPEPDATPAALAIMRRARALGVGPQEALRKYLDGETVKVARRRAELEKK